MHSSKSSRTSQNTGPRRAHRRQARSGRRRGRREVRSRRRSRCLMASSALGAICSAATSRSLISTSPSSLGMRTMRALISVRSPMSELGCAPAMTVRPPKRRGNCSGMGDLTFSAIAEMQDTYWCWLGRLGSPARICGNGLTGCAMAVEAFRHGSGAARDGRRGEVSGRYRAGREAAMMIGQLLGRWLRQQSNARRRQARYRGAVAAGAASGFR